MGVSCSSPGAVATARAEPRLPAGAVLESCSSQARYTADRRLGAGSFGQVWLCHEEKRSALRAVKLLPGNRARSVAKEVTQCRRATEAAGEHHVPRCSADYDSVPHKAPEILGRTPKYSEKSDVWAYGITAIELATGRPPLQDRHAKNANRVMCQVAMRPVPAVPQDIGYSQHFVAMAQSCLARDPKARPSLRELLQGKYLRTPSDAGHESVRRWLANRDGGCH